MQLSDLELHRVFEMELISCPAVQKSVGRAQRTAQRARSAKKTPNEVFGTREERGERPMKLLNASEEFRGIPTQLLSTTAEYGIRSKV